MKPRLSCDVNTENDIYLPDPGHPAALVATQLPSGFTDFLGLKKIVPFGARTLRTLIKKGIIPHIRVKGGRRLLFHIASVEKALLRFQKGGICE